MECHRRSGAVSTGGGGFFALCRMPARTGIVALFAKQAGAACCHQRRKGTFVTQYTYDAMDRVVDMTYPDGEVVHHDYNPQGLLESVDGYDTYVEQMDYNALEQMELQELGNGLDVDYQYYSASEDNNRLQRIQIPNRLDLEYTYDDVGNVWSITDGENGGQAQHFRYDALDRLTEAWTSGGGEGSYDETYGYDEIGNVTLKNGLSYWYESSQPHAVQALLAGSYAVAEYSYDANGNMTARDENSTEYTQAFDAENRLKSVTTGGETTTFTYDGDGNLVKKGDDSGTTVYVGDHYEVQGGTVIKYYFAGGKRVAQRRDGVVYYLHGDHLGSTSLVTSQTSNVISRQLYHPYGETRWSDGALPTDYQFTDQRHETGLGLYDYNARYYDPYLGRFISADTIVPEPGNPQDLNRYAYVRNNPLRYTDPSGHALEDGFGILWRYTPSGELRAINLFPPGYGHSDRDLTYFAVMQAHAMAGSEEIKWINLANDIIVGKPYSYIKFRSLVKDSARWDIKDQMERQLGRSFRLCSQQACNWYEYSVLGNILYGFTGAEANFAEWEIRIGAAYAEARDPENAAKRNWPGVWPVAYLPSERRPYWYDEEHDYHAVGMGIEMSRRYGSDVTIREFQSLLVDYSEGLAGGLPNPDPFPSGADWPYVPGYFDNK